MHLQTALGKIHCLFANKLNSAVCAIVFWHYLKSKCAGFKSLPISMTPDVQIRLTKFWFDRVSLRAFSTGSVANQVPKNTTKSPVRSSVQFEAEALDSAPGSCKLHAAMYKYCRLMFFFHSPRCCGSGEGATTVLAFTKQMPPFSAASRSMT